MKENDYEIGPEVCKLAHTIRRMVDSSQRHKYIDNMLGSTNGWVLGYIAKSSGDVYQKDLEKQFSIRRSSVSKMLSSLEEKGLVMREGVKGDARLKRLVLTDKARKIHAIAEEDRAENERALRNGITDEEISAFMSVLKKIEKNAWKQTKREGDNAYL